MGATCSTDSDCDALSLQAQLLGAGVCDAGGFCTAGNVGLACAEDGDCGILARSYRIPKTLSSAQAFFPGFIDEKVQEQVCPGE